MRHPGDPRHRFRGILSPVVISRVGAELVPRHVERGSLAAAVADHAFDRVREIVPRHQLEDVVGEEAPQAREQEGDPVNDGVLTLALRARTEQQSLEDGVPLLLENGGELQPLAPPVCAEADGTMRPQRLEVEASHGPFSR